MKFEKNTTQELIEIYKKIQDFVIFLEKEKNTNSKEK
jgi:hypothetical protein